MEIDAYYLQQMGITLWVNRSSSNTQSETPEFLMIVPKKKDAHSFVVLEIQTMLQEEEWEKSVTARLLNNILLSIGILNDAAIVLIKPGTSSESLQHIDSYLQEQCMRLQPKVVLFFGQERPKFLESNIPFFQSVSLATILSSPLKKKKVFRELILLKNDLFRDLSKC